MKSRRDQREVTFVVADLSYRHTAVLVVDSDEIHIIRNRLNTAVSASKSMIRWERKSTEHSCLS